MFVKAVLFHYTQAMADMNKPPEMISGNMTSGITLILILRIYFTMEFSDA